MSDVLSDLLKPARRPAIVQSKATPATRAPPSKPRVPEQRWSLTPFIPAASSVPPRKGAKTSVGKTPRSSKEPEPPRRRNGPDPQMLLQMRRMNRGQISLDGEALRQFEAKSAPAEIPVSRTPQNPPGRPSTPANSSQRPTTPKGPTPFAGRVIGGVAQPSKSRPLLDRPVQGGPHDRRGPPRRPPPREGVPRDPREITSLDLDDESMDEYEDDFIDDDDGLGGEEDWKKALRGLTGYDSEKFREADQSEIQEATSNQIMMEETRSAAIGKHEDFVEFQRIKEEERREAMRRKRQ